MNKTDREWVRRIIRDMKNDKIPPFGLKPKQVKRLNALKAKIR